MPPRRLQSTDALPDIQLFLSTPSIMAAIAVEFHRTDLQPPVNPPRKLVIQRLVTIPPPPPTHKALSKPSLGRYRSTLVPGLHVVYKVRVDNRLAIVEDGERYTCTVTISPNHGRTSRLTAQLLPDGPSVDTLHLTASYLDGAGRFDLDLAPEQLRPWLKFLLIAPSTGGGARTLVTRPACHQMDVMCVVFAYLSSTIEEDVEDILQAVDIVEELHSVWRGKGNGDEMGGIWDLVAKMPCTLPQMWFYSENCQLRVALWDVEAHSRNPRFFQVASVESRGKRTRSIPRISPQYSARTDLRHSGFRT